MCLSLLTLSRWGNNMSKLIRGYKISSSNASIRQVSTVNVKRGMATMLSMRSEQHSNLLSFIRRHPASVERQEFVNSLLGVGVQAGDVEAILCGL